MLQLWPHASPIPLDDDALAALYAYPDHPGAPFVRVNFVSSVDGAASVDGRSAGLSSTPDQRVFHLLRQLCEVVLVGAGTARSENYSGARGTSRGTGLPPRIAVVTRSAALDPTGPLFTDTVVPPLVITSAAAPANNRRRLTEAGAEVVVLSTDRVDPTELLAALEQRGLRRVLCEGGPRLFADLIAADVVDELCLTVTPLLAGGGADRIAEGVTPARYPTLALVSVTTERDVLLLRYRRTPR